MKTYQAVSGYTIPPLFSCEPAWQNSYMMSTKCNTWKQHDVYCWGRMESKQTAQVALIMNSKDCFLLTFLLRSNTNIWIQLFCSFDWQKTWGLKYILTLCMINAVDAHWRSTIIFSLTSCYYAKTQEQTLNFENKNLDNKRLEFICNHKTF